MEVGRMENPRMVDWQGDGREWQKYTPHLEDDFS
jgi:hypothetical protein